MKYFAYGSNMDVAQLSYRIERKVQPHERMRAALAGYSLKFNKMTTSHPGEGKANIVEDPRGKTEGILDTITDEELAKLADYERGYEKKPVRVDLQDGTQAEAITFVAKSARVKDGLKPSRAYLCRLLAGKDFVSPEYYEMLKSIQTLD